MNELNDALRSVAELFHLMEIPYVLMGGIAVRAYGIPRPTYDVDFTAAVSRDRLPELFRRVEERGFAVPEAYQSGWVDRVASFPLVKFRKYLGENSLDIDVFLAESAFQHCVISRGRQEDVENFLVRLVTPEDLVLLKLIASRPRDLADIADVLFVQVQLDAWCTLGAAR
ncbi:MAG: nucleotidyl transferase AbiEii/AbiGii toxin family protein [Pirellulaceae bacterium]|nr:nucleotidyl transferase AbiEii/AbiGii toxin family protein [Pirellulaceae bacterium]